MTWQLLLHARLGSTRDARIEVVKCLCACAPQSDTWQAFAIVTELLGLTPTWKPQ
jgi:hypothetical protein